MIIELNRFHLETKNNQHEICKVEDDSLAKAAAMAEGDVVLEVNGQRVNGISHEASVSMIQVLIFL